MSCELALRGFSEAAGSWENSLDSEQRRVRSRLLEGGHPLSWVSQTRGSGASRSLSSARSVIPLRRVLEVGCGEGELARALARVGHSVTAIDPQAPEGPIFRRTRIEEFTDPDQFDHVVAILSLHHVEDLGMALSNMADLAPRGGEPDRSRVRLGPDRRGHGGVGPRAPSGRLPAREAFVVGALLPEMGAWGRRREPRPGDHAEAHFAEWAGEEGFHSSRQMRDELGRRFVERFFEWVPYLYPDLGEDVSESDESAAIEAGTINSTGFRYVGIRLALIET